MFSTKRLGNGLFQVLWDSKPTVYEIFNGSLGLSGRSKNYYGISVNNKVKPFSGSLAFAKKVCQYWIEEALKTNKNIYRRDIVKDDIHIRDTLVKSIDIMDDR